MLAILVITLSSAAGVFGGSLWVAFGSGVLLAMVGFAERLPTLRRAQAISGGTIAISVGASLLLAQMASIGTFAVGRLLGGILLA